MRSNNKIIGVGLLTAISASLCCITPILALIAGTSGLASAFSWLEPFRPYLIGVTVLVIGFAWYQKLKSKKEADCDCETEEKPKFMQSKKFLAMVTIFAALMLSFPYYSKVFYPKTDKEIIIVDENNVETVHFSIEGMTCESCAEHINYAINELEGIIKVTVSYEEGYVIVDFDNSITGTKKIEKAINATGYTVTRKRSQ